MKRLSMFLGMVVCVLLLGSIRVGVCEASYMGPAVIEQYGDEPALYFLKKPYCKMFELYTSVDKINWKLSSDDYFTHDEISMEGNTSLYCKVRGVYYDDDSESSTPLYTEWSNIVEIVVAPNIKSVKANCSSITANSCVLSINHVKGANLYKVEVNGKEYVSNNTVFKITKMKKNILNTAQVYVGRVSSDNSHTVYKKVKDLYLPVKPAKIKMSKLLFREIYDNGLLYFEGIKINCKYRVSVEIWSAYGKSKKLKTYNKSKSDYYAFKPSFLASGKNSKMYKFRIRVGFPNVNGKYVYGGWSDWKYISPVVGLDMTSAGYWNYAKFKWNPVKGAKGYNVYVRNSTTGKAVLYKRTTRTEIEIPNTDWVGGVRVIPYTVVGGKRKEALFTLK